MEKQKISFKERYKKIIYPSRYKVGLKEIDRRAVIKIQSHMRRYYAMRLYKLLKIKRQKDSRAILVARWCSLFKHEIFSFIINYHQNQSEFAIRAHSSINPKVSKTVSCYLWELPIDVKSLTKSIVEKIALYIKDHLVIGIKGSQMQIRVDFETLIQDLKSSDISKFVSSVDDLDYGATFSQTLKIQRDNRRDLAYELCTTRVVTLNVQKPPRYLPEIQAQCIGIRRQETKNPTDVALLREEQAIVKIQRSYRAHKIRQYCSQRHTLSLEEAHVTSKSRVLLRTFRFHTTNPLPVLPQKRQSIFGSFLSGSHGSNAGSKFISHGVTNPYGKASPELIFEVDKEFEHTSRLAHIQVYLLKADKPRSDIFILCHFELSVTGKSESIMIPVSDITKKFKLKKFIKKIDKKLISCLQYNRHTQVIHFEQKAKENKKPEEKKKKHINSIFSAQKKTPKEIQTEELLKFKQQQQQIISDTKNATPEGRALIKIQRLVKAKMARRKFELLIAATRSQKRRLKETFKKVNGIYISLQYYLVTQAEAIRIHASQVENRDLKGSAVVALKELMDPHLMPDALAKAQASSPKNLYLLFVEPVNKLEDLLKITTTSTNITIQLMPRYESSQVKNSGIRGNQKRARISSRYHDSVNSVAAHSITSTTPNAFDLLDKDKSASTVIQDYDYNRSSLHEKAGIQFERYEIAALKIQTTYRKRSAQRLYEWKRKRYTEEVAQNKKFICRRTKRISKTIYIISICRKRDDPEVYILSARDLSSNSETDRVLPSKEFSLPEALLNSVESQVIDFIVDRFQVIEKKISLRLT